MAGVSLFAWINSVKTATLIATAAEANLPVTNVSNDQGSPAQAWQTPAGVTTASLTIVLPVRTSLRVFGFYRTNLTSAAVVSASLYTTPTALVGTQTMSVSNGAATGVLTAALSADFVIISITDTTNPDGFLSIPLAFAGIAWQPLTALSYSTTMGRDDLSDTIITRGGQQWINMRATSRRWELALDGVRESEAFTQLDALDRASRTGSNVLVVPNISGANMAAEAAFGVLKGTADIGWPYAAADRRSWRARLTERL